MNKTEEKKAEYVLVNDLTGNPPKGKTPTVIHGYGYDVKVPHSPNKNCKPCRGTGFLGRDSKNKIPLICKKCYPKNL